MDFDEILSSMTLEIYENLRTAVELGKWPDGTKLSTEQTEVLLQATLAYAARENLTPDELFSINQDGNILDAKSQKITYLQQKPKLQNKNKNTISVRTEHE